MTDGVGKGAQPAFFRRLDLEGRRRNSAGSKIPDDLPPGGAVYSVMHVIRMARVLPNAAIGKPLGIS
jgi:hypothetical protein